MATAITSPTNSTANPFPEDDRLYEVVDGQVVEKPPMGTFEVEIATLLVTFLNSFVLNQRLGKVVCEALFRIDPARNLQRRPDVAFVSDARWPYNQRTSSEAAWDVVPDLAIEVVSPSNTANEVVGKVAEYFQAGVQRVWVVYPQRCQVYVYESPTAIRVLSRGDELDGETLLPGFRLALASLFKDDTLSPPTRP